VHLVHFPENRPVDSTTRSTRTFRVALIADPHGASLPAIGGRALFDGPDCRKMGRDVVCPPRPSWAAAIRNAESRAAAGPVHQAKVERPISGTRCQNIHLHPVTLRVQLRALPPSRAIYRSRAREGRALGESVKRVALPAVHHARSRTSAATSATTKDGRGAEEGEREREDGDGGGGGA